MPVPQARGGGTGRPGLDPLTRKPRTPESPGAHFLIQHPTELGVMLINTHDTAIPSRTTTPIPRGGSLGDRFWSKVDRRGADECWPWRGAVCPQGYGFISIQASDSDLPFSRWTSLRAHRVSAEFAGLDIDGMQVLHSCDNPPCVNPAHLRAGTARDNSRDMVARGRNRTLRSLQGPRAFSQLELAEIARRFRAGEPNSVIAEAFNATIRTIARIGSGQSDARPPATRQRGTRIDWTGSRSPEPATSGGLS